MSDDGKGCNAPNSLFCIIGLICTTFSPQQHVTTYLPPPLPPPFTHDDPCWGAKFQRNVLLVSAGGCLKMGVACLLGTVSIPDDWVSVWRYTFLVLFGLK